MQSSGGNIQTIHRSEQRSHTTLLDPLEVYRRLSSPAVHKATLSFGEARRAWDQRPVAEFHTRFIDSESDLDSTLNQFLPLTQNPPLYYPELVKQGTLALWSNLLSHENTDIAVDVIGVIQELTDEDVGRADEDEGDDDEDDEEKLGESSRSAAKKIADGTPMAMAEFIDELVRSPRLRFAAPLLRFRVSTRTGTLFELKTSC